VRGLSGGGTPGRASFVARVVGVAGAVVVTLLASIAGPAAAGVTDGSNEDDTVSADVEVTLPGGPGSGGGDGPVCHYEPPKYTTQDEQHNDIRPDEVTGPGVFGWLICDDGTSEFIFFPDAQPIDPVVLARSVQLSPPPPDLRTNPDADARSLVGLETWFWAAGAGAPLSRSASVGPVTVEVYATPRSLVVDPGDGTGTFVCTDLGTAYDMDRSASAQTTSCGHTYSRPGSYTATATLVYDVGFTSNVGEGGGLGTIEPSATASVTVVESQAVVVGS
jgi:hypothetical protein